MTVRTRQSFKFYAADIYDSFGMFQTKIITREQLKQLARSRKVVVAGGSDEYDQLRRMFNIG